MEAKLSVWSSYYIELSPEDAVREFKKYGYSCSELSDEHGEMLLHRGEPKAVGAAFRKFLEEEHFEMKQGHLWLKCKICSDPGMPENLFPWLDLYEAIGVENAVLHCDPMIGEPDLSEEARHARNLAALKKIQDYLEAHQMKLRICLENLRLRFYSVEELLSLVTKLSPDHFGICLDTGHLNLTEKNPRHFILAAGKYLRALHIADNEGETDQHLMPYGRGNVDIAAVVQALREIDYHGYFNYEIPGERKAPLPILGYKLDYIRKCYDYLMEE